MIIGCSTEDSGIEIASCYISNCNKLLKNIGILFGAETITCFEFEGIIDDVIDFFAAILDKLGIFGVILKDLVNALEFIFGLIHDFKFYLENFISTLKEMTGIDLDRNIIKEILKISKSFTDFLASLFAYILFEGESVIPDTDVDIIEKIIQKLQDIELDLIDWDKVQYVLFHGIECFQKVDLVLNCTEEIEGLAFESPTKEEILSQTWDKTYYYDQWENEVRKLDCAHEIGRFKNNVLYRKKFSTYKQLIY